MKLSFDLKKAFKMLKLPVLFGRSSEKGLTLIEAAIAMAVLSIISVAVSNLILNGVDANMSQRRMVLQESIGMNIIDTLRVDMRFARAGSVQVSNGGQTLSLRNLNNIPVVYNFTGTTLNRTSNGVTMDFSTLASDYPVIIQSGPLGFVECPGPSCLPAPPPGSNSVGSGIRLDALSVVDNSSAQSLLDQNFGRANFTVTNVMFNQLTAANFE